MDRSKSFTYPYSTASTSRYSSTHATSSAFSASANPNEDWTKISDLAERRRIQNRIAQRNYRKKLKRRLEDLERRAGSSSASPEQTPRQLSVELSTMSEQIRPQAPFRQLSRSSQRSNTRHASPEPMLQEDRASLFGQHSPRQLSASPPPSLSYATYPPADTSFYSTFSQQPYSTAQMSYPDYSFSPSYGYSLPTMLPTLASQGQKRETVFTDDDILSPFSMNYASMAGMQLPAPQDYWNTGVHTPPLSLSDELSLDESRETSPSHFMYPGTPSSLPHSPAFDFGIVDL